MRRLLVTLLLVAALPLAVAGCQKDTGHSPAFSSPAPASAHPAPGGAGTAIPTDIPSPGKNDHNGTECVLNYLPNSTGLSVIPGSHGANVIIGTVSVTCNPPPLRHKLALTIYKQSGSYRPAIVGNAVYDSSVSRNNLPSPTIIKTVTALCSPGSFFMTAVATGDGPPPQGLPLFSSGAGYVKTFFAKDCG